MPPEGRAFGVVFQDGALFPHLDVRQNVELGLPRGTAAPATFRERAPFVTAAAEGSACEPSGTRVVSKEIPGFGELFRWLSYQDIGTSTIQSRATAALCGKTYFFLLPGSPGAVRLAMDKILIPQLDVRHRPCNFVELFPRIRNEREDTQS